MFHGKMKAVTFSYDDGVTQDIRLIKLFDKYNLRCTFNINSQLAGKSGSLIRKGKKVDHNKINLSDIKEIYKGHEIAVHTLTHPNLTLLKDEEIIWQVEEDKKNLERASGKKIYGMAYPGGGINWNRHVARVIQAHTSIQYARTTDITDGFGRQKNLFAFRPNAYHVMNMERLFSVGEKFLREEESEEKIVYIWGHSYEFDIADTWNEFERFLELISGHENIFYGTNREVLLDCR